jgi:hypothetical protein
MAHRPCSPLLATRMSVTAGSDLNGHPDEIDCQMHFLQQSTLTGQLSTFERGRTSMALQ